MADKSKKYIIMCIKASKIQIHKMGEGDTYYVDFSKSGWRNNPELIQTHKDEMYDDKDKEIGEYKLEYVHNSADIRNNGISYHWIPTHDQLRMLLGDTHNINPVSWISFLYNAMHENVSCPDIDKDGNACKLCVNKAMYFRAFKTIEKLCLAFVMYELYKSIWDGDCWILQTSWGKKERRGNNDKK